MRIEVLGCHGGDVPERRLPTFLVEGRLLLEAGAVTSALPLERQATIRHVLLSHAHLDHIVGLAFLVDNVQAVAREIGPVTAASLPPVIEDCRAHCFNNRLWPDFTRLPAADAPALRLDTLRPGEPTDIAGLTVVPVPVHHAVPAAGFVVSDGRTAFAFSGDTGPTDELWRVARRFRTGTLIVETAFPNRMEALARASGHFTPALLARELDKMPDGPVWVYHVKPTYYEETAAELARLGDRIRLLEQDRTYTV